MPRNRQIIAEGPAARYIGVSRRTLRRWRQLRKGPRYHKFGNRLVLYDLRDIRIWMRENGKGEP